MGLLGQGLIHVMLTISQTIGEALPLNDSLMAKINEGQLNGAI